MEKSKLIKSDNNPFPVVLGEMKAPLAKEASTHERSLHWWIQKILKKYCIENGLIKK